MRTNLEYAAHTPTLYNLRGHEEALRMERDGFELVKNPIAVPLSLDADAEDRTQEYLEATTSWLEDRFHAEKVLCYAFRVGIPNLDSFVVKPSILTVRVVSQDRRCE